MRARHAVIAFIGLGLVASLACSRNANQQNFIGAECKAAADCPPELLCVNNACWTRCSPAGTCPNPNETCILNACVPGGQGGGGEDGGKTGQTDGASAGPDFDANTQQPIESDGTPLVTNIVLSGPAAGQTQMFANDTHVLLKTIESGGLNGDTTVLKVSPAGTWAPQTLATLDDQSAFVLIANGSAYYTKGGGGPSAAVYRRKLDMSDAETDTSITLRTDVGGAPGVISGTDFVFVNGASQIRVIDTATGTLDAQVYGTVSTGGGAGARVGKNGTSIMWLANDIMKSHLWSATEGAAGNDTTYSFNNQPDLAFIHPVGTKAFILLGGGAGGTLNEIETSPIGTPSIVSAYPTDNTIQTQPPITFGNFLYYAKTDNGGGGGTVLAKFDLASKTEVKSNKRVAGGKLWMSSSGIYAMEMIPTNGGGGATQAFRVAKFPLF